MPPLILEWLLEFGSEVQTHGAAKRCFDKAARKRLAHSVGAQVVDRMGGLLNFYLIDGEAQIVTVGVRTRRTRQP